MKISPYFIGKSEQRSTGYPFDWIEATFHNPDYEEVEENGRIRRWRWIEEKGRHLRVVVLTDRETVLNSFWDRNFKR